MEPLGDVPVHVRTRERRRQVTSWCVLMDVLTFRRPRSVLGVPRGSQTALGEPLPWPSGRRTGDHGPRAARRAEWSPRSRSFIGTRFTYRAAHLLKGERSAALSTVTELGSRPLGRSRDVVITPEDAPPLMAVTLPSPPDPGSRGDRSWAPAPDVSHVPTRFQGTELHCSVPAREQGGVIPRGFPPKSLL